MQSGQRGVLPGLMLVLIGLLLLAGNVVSLSAWFYLLGAGIAFLVAYFFAKRLGLLIAGCILSTLGLYAPVADRLATEGQEVALFFVFLGLAFAAIYALRRMWQVRWPLVVAGILLALGAAISLASSITIDNLRIWAGLAQWWPVILVLFGAWLLFARRLSSTARIASGLTLALLAILFILSSVSAGLATSLMAGDGNWNWFGTHRVEARETVERIAQLPAGGKLIVSNRSGSTTIHRGDTGDVRLVATKHSWSSSVERARENLSNIQVRVDEHANAVEIDWTHSNGVEFFGMSPGASVDYDIAVPANISVEVKSSSGRVSVRDVEGAVSVRSSSGDVELTQIGGAANVAVSSGEIRLQGVGGRVDAESSSGRIVAQDIGDAFRLETRSGGIDLLGYIRTAGEVKASSGSVRLTPGVESAFLLDAATRSGSVSVDAKYGGGQRKKNEQTATVGTGGPTVSVRVSSGNITLN